VTRPRTISTVLGLLLAVLVTSWVFRPGQPRTAEEVTADVQAAVEANLEQTAVVAGPDEQGHRVWIDEDEHRIYVALCRVGEPLVALGAKYGGGVMTDDNPEHVTEPYDLTCVQPSR